MSRRRLLSLLFLLMVPCCTLVAQSSGVLPNALVPLITPTADGSGQVTEPGVVKFPFPWHGFEYWMVVAPYPNDDAKEENPSLLVSNDGQHWSNPPGASTPVGKPVPGSHLDDASLFFDAISNQLWLFYISEDEFRFTNVMRTTSIDGAHWSIPQIVIRAPDYEMVMPAVAKIGDLYWLWSVNAGQAGCSASATFVQYRTSSDGVHWSAPNLTDIAQPGYRIWHIGVTELHLLISRQGGDRETTNDSGLPYHSPVKQATSEGPILSPSIYAMLVSAYQSNCGDDNLFLALSSDGIHWSHFGAPLLTPDPGHWDGHAIYKSTLTFDLATNLMTIWYSAWAETQQGVTWHVGATQGKFWNTLHKLWEVP